MSFLLAGRAQARPDAACNVAVDGDVGEKKYAVGGIEVQSYVGGAERRTPKAGVQV